MDKPSIWTYDMRDDVVDTTDKIMLYVLRYGLWFYVVALALVVWRLK